MPVSGQVGDFERYLHVERGRLTDLGAAIDAPVPLERLAAANSPPGTTSRRRTLELM